MQPKEPIYLCLNATGSVTTAVAIQPVASALHVLADLVREGDAGDVIDDIIREMLLGRALLLRAPPIHFSQYDRIGLRGAIARLKADLRPGGLGSPTSSPICPTTPPSASANSCRGTGLPINAAAA